MTCPYCLAFSRDAFQSANPKRKTLVQAYWEFEEEKEKWVAFGPAVSGLLETSYGAWLKDPKSQKAPEVQCGKFLYRVDYAFMLPEHKGHVRPQVQKMRRIGVTSSEIEMCTVDKKVYEEFRKEREGLRTKLEGAEKERSEEAERHGRQLADLEAELRQLRETCAGQLQELGELRLEVEGQRAASAELRKQLAGIFPGRFVKVVAGTGGAGLPSDTSPGDLGRVRAVEGQAVAVDFPGRRGLWVPHASLSLDAEAQWLACPGSRVEWRDGGHDADGDAPRQCGVVCDSVDGLSVSVLCADGKKRVRALKSLSPDRCARSPDSPLEVGDLVQVQSLAGVSILDSHGVPPESVGMVVLSEGSEVAVRFRGGGGGAAADLDDEGGVDVSLDLQEVSVVRDEAANLVRPGAAVRFRADRPPPAGVAAGPRPPVGVVYATHGDGTAVADFLGNFGFRCSIDCLEVVDEPETTEHAVLRLLSECLAWSEVSAQQTEEREEASLLRLMSSLPTAVVPSSGSSPSFSAAEVASGSGLFHLLSKTLLGSLVGLGSASLLPLSIERAEGLRSPDLEKVYELGLRRLQAVRPTGCSELADVEALQIHGGQEWNEYFLWYAAPLDVVDDVCRSGFRIDADGGGHKANGRARAPGPRFAESASVAELRASEGGSSDPNGMRCLLLVRVLLGECLAVPAHAALHDAWPAQPEGGPYDSLCVAPSDVGGGAVGREFVVHHLSQALPLFRIFYRHELGRC